MDYETVKTTLMNMADSRADVLDAFFMPLAVGFHYQIAPLGMELPTGGMIVDHSNGMIKAKPDEDSSVIFYSRKDQSEWKTPNEIHVYLDGRSILIDLPRFGTISRRSKITFDGTEDDIANFENFSSLIDFQKRQESMKANQDGIKFMDMLQFQDDLSTVVDNPNEHFRFIPQILNDSISSGDDDLIEFIVKKIKKRFDPLDDPENEKTVKSYIEHDFKRRAEEGNALIVTDEEERKTRQKEQPVNENENTRASLAIGINEIFKRARSNESAAENEQPKSGATQTNVAQAGTVQTNMSQTEPTSSDVTRSISQVSVQKNVQTLSRPALSNPESVSQPKQTEQVDVETGGETYGSFV